MPTVNAGTRVALRLPREPVAELLATDCLVIATPIYDHNVPAALKAWIDHIVRNGLILGMDGSGLVTGRRTTCLPPATSAGGSPIRTLDIVTSIRARGRQGDRSG